MELLKESVFDYASCDIVTEEETKEKRWYLSGPTLMAETPNQNRRVYPMTVLESAINKHIENDKLLSGRCVGELQHPSTNSTEINLENISHKFLSVEKDKNIFITKAQLLNTPKGKIAQNLLSEGVKLGFSSRALGNMVESNGVRVVKECQIISLADIVFEPSIAQFAEAIKENQEWVFDNGVLVKKDLSEEIDKYKSIIKEAKAKDIQKVVKAIFADYMSKLK